MPAPQSDHSLDSSTNAGFTIVETLVALFVFALAGVALVTMQTESTSALTRVESHALANIVAENNLIDAMASRSPLELGERNGEVDLAGRAWTWTLEIARTDDPATLRIRSLASDVGHEAPDADVTAYAVASGAQ